ncbi:MAG TPA: thioredoxin-disulfide reductase [Actinobacteria bacterium]|nr:thioredoxin-disulfide reductase [Actinomycetes bacterium]HEX21124.1 thioredoxin-disulfide reductase [Actinomycetota bacterium]
MKDLIIVGAGPAGFTAAIYGLRAKLDLFMLEKTGPGGQIALSDVIENYPGYSSISGLELMQKFEEHAKKFGLEIQSSEVTGVEDRGDYKLVKTTSGDIETKAVIICSGAKPRKLDVPGEKEFTGRGVSYCATCDGFFFKGKDVVTVGGGDTAVKESLFLTKMVNKVFLVHRRDALRAEKIIQEKALTSPKINIKWDAVVTEIKGNTKVEGVAIKNVKTGAEEVLPVQGIFIFVGIVPNTGFLNLVDKDEAGFVKVNKKMETNIPGIFAAGDCRDTPLRQVVTAVGDAAIAVTSAETYIERLK